MSETKFLDESATSALGPVAGKRRWKARIIAAGLGSMGLYTSEALATAAQAFPIGTKVNADHATWEERNQRPAGSITTMIGVIASEPFVEADEVYAEVEFLEEWAPTIEQIAPFVGLSIHASVQSVDETEDGIPIVTAFIPHPLNTVDVVTVAGAKGKLLEVMESINCDIMDTENENQEIEEGMKPEDIAAIVAGVTEAVTKAITPEPVLEEEKDKVDVTAVAEAVIASELPEIARKQVYAAIENGIEVEEAIAAQKTYVDEIAKTFEVEESFEGKRKMGNPKNQEAPDLSVGIWSN